MKTSVIIMLHLIFWIFSSLFLLLGFNLLALPATVLGGGGLSAAIQLSALLITLPIGACIFYASYFSFGFFIKKPIRYIWWTVAYLLLISAIVGYQFSISGKVSYMDILITIFPILYFNVFGWLLRTLIEWIKDRKIKSELEKDKLETQLELLKSKINPHFLFNTLNNIDVLILDTPERASEFLKKLSEILRFILYESNTETIPLVKELEYVRKYIDLQKIRTSNEKFVLLEISGSESEKFIAPMIIIPFIENAFKFATNKKVENGIVIKINISGSILTFYCKNSCIINESSANLKNGLGSGLIKQRLDLIYGKGYSLEAFQEENWYIVKLEIKLNDH